MTIGALDSSAKEIVEHARRTNARFAGQCRCRPVLRDITVLRSPHIDKKSREQFELRTHKRLIDIYEANARTGRNSEQISSTCGRFCKDKGVMICQSRSQTFGLCIEVYEETN